MTLSAAQRSLIEGLIVSAPDTVIHALDQALKQESEAQGRMADIARLVSVEAMERRARAAAFGPIAPLCVRTDQAKRSFPSRTLRELWAALKAEAPDQVSMVIEASRRADEIEEGAPVFNNLCSAAAIGLRSPGGTPFETSAHLLDQAEHGGAAQFANYLDLAPLSRQAGAKLGDWVGRMTGDRAAAVRLAYRDATAIAPDGGPRLLEILAGQLAEPWQILRLVSAIENKPSDVFLEGSELAGLGRRFLDDIDRAIEALNAFDPSNGGAAGHAAADALARAVAQITEFEQNLDLKRDGPWGSRIFKQKAVLAKKVEALLKRAEDAVGAALPLKPSKVGRAARGMPNLHQPPDAAAIARAQAMLAFVERCRPTAQAGGYASLRAKVVERLDDRLDNYVDDLLENLRSEAPEEPVRSSEFLEVAAELVGLFRDDKAANIVRRRAAA